MAKQYITLKQAAQKWKSKAWYIKKACDAGQIPEAVKLNEEWIIPADLERPHMYIENKGEVKETVYGHGEAYKKHIYKMTMEGFPSFEVEICEVGGTKYEVYSCFSADAKRTASEALWDYALYEASEEGKKKGDTILGRFENIKKLEARTNKSLPPHLLAEVEALDSAMTIDVTPVEE